MTVVMTVTLTTVDAQSELRRCRGCGGAEGRHPQLSRVARRCSCLFSVCNKEDPPPPPTPSPAPPIVVDSHLAPRVSLPKS